MLKHIREILLSSFVIPSISPLLLLFPAELNICKLTLYFVQEVSFETVNCPKGYPRKVSFFLELIGQSRDKTPFGTHS